jgi:hypothetical protein
MRSSPIRKITHVTEVALPQRAKIWQSVEKERADSRRWFSDPRSIKPSPLRVDQQYIVKSDESEVARRVSWSDNVDGLHKVGIATRIRKVADQSICHMT